MSARKKAPAAPVYSSRSAVGAVAREITAASDRLAWPIHHAFDRFLDVASAVVKRAPDSEWNPLVEGLERAMPHFQAAFGELLFAAGHSYEDILGPVYMQLGRNSERLGQFFTPWSVAQAMALMTATSHRQPTPEEPPRVLDPACGSGVMLLAAADAFPEELVRGGLVEFYGIDLDPYCARMAWINLRIHGLAGAVECRNALAMPVAGIAERPEPIASSAPAVPRVEVPPPPPKTRRPSKGAEQLPLFSLLTTPESR